jgi:hypothetical protein
VEIYQNLVRDLLNVDEAGNFVNVMLDKEVRIEALAPFST